MKKAHFNVFREGAVHVRRKRCATCIFNPTSPVFRSGAIDKALASDNVVVCHDTLGTPANSVCRGYYDEHAEDVSALRLARALGVVEYDEGGEKGQRLH